MPPITSLRGPKQPLSYRCSNKKPELRNLLFLPPQPIQLPSGLGHSNGGEGSGGGGGRVPVGGVSFLPQGRGKQAAAAAAASASAHGGSTESLNSTQSLTLSNLSFGSTTSTGETRFI